MRTIIFLFFIIVSANTSADEAYPEWQLSEENGIGKVIKVDVSGNVIAGADLETTIPGKYLIRKYNPRGNVIWSNIGTCTGSTVIDLILDSSANIYSTGYCSDSGGIYTMKLDSSGTPQWFTTYSTTGNVNAITYDGNFIYICGYSIVNGNKEILVVKYDLNGNQIFASTTNLSGNEDNIAYSIDVDPSGNVYVAGTTINPFTGIDDIVLKYSSSGTLLWDVNYGKTDSVDAVYKLVYRNGFLYAAGTSNGAGTGNDCLLYKLDANDGSGIWLKRYNGPENGNDTLSDMKLDAYGNIYVACSGKGTLYIDIVTLKYNSNGIQQWTKRYVNPYYNSFARVLTIDNAQNVYVYSTDYIDANGKAAKYNPAGNQKYIGYYYGICIGFPNLQCYNQYIRSIDIDNSGNLYLTGSEILDYTNDNIIVVGKIIQEVTNTLNLKLLIQGFYDPVNDLSVSDTVQVNLRKNVAPFEIVYSENKIMDQNGNSPVNFNLNSNTGLNYYLVLKHRNSLETWSSESISFLKDSLNYDFTKTNSGSYGNNLIQKGAKWTLYSGDVNQDGFIDLSDNSLVYNDLINFTSGYKNTDVNGDNMTDLNDLTLTYSNSISLISVIRP